MFEYSDSIPAKIYDSLLGVSVALLGYFSPIQGIAHMVILFFVIDVFYGWRVDKKLNNARFKPSIVWEKTVPRAALSIVLLVASYMLDKETDQHWIETYKVVGWLISALLIISITRNGYILTKWSTIQYIGDYFSDRIFANTRPKIKKRKEKDE